MLRPARPARRNLLLALTVTTVVALLALGPTSAAAAATPPTYMATPSNPWWVNGRVNAIVIVGDTVIVGGDFTAAVGPGGATLPRARLAAFHLGDGAPVEGFRADTDGTVNALVASGTRVFVGGDFTHVGGRGAARLAEIDAATGGPGALSVGATSAVAALAIGDGRLYVGGRFGGLGGLVRSRLGAVDLASGTVVADFAPVIDDQVRALATLGGRLWVGGQFGTVDGLARRSLVELDPAGRVVGPVFAITEMVWDLAVTPDGATVHAGLAGVGGASRNANSLVALSTATGGVGWRIATDGDVQAVAGCGSEVYFGFHDGLAGETTVHLLAADATTGALSGFRPAMGGFWGVWALACDDRRLVVGGEFRSLDAAARNLAVHTATAPPPTPTATPPPPPEDPVVK